MKSTLSNISIHAMVMGNFLTELYSLNHGQAMPWLSFCLAYITIEI